MRSLPCDQRATACSASIPPVQNLAGGDRVRVGGAQDSLAVGDHLLVEGDGVLGTPRLLVGGGEVGAGPDRVRRGAAHRIGVGNASEREILVARDRWARSRRSASVAQGLAPLAGFVTAVAVVLGGPARAVAAPVAPATARPPDVAAFIPAGYRVTAVVKVNLDGAAVDEEAITAVGTAPPQGLVPTTVVLIAWDSYALRWTSVFDAAQQSSYQTESQMGQKGPGLIAPEQPGPQVAVIHDLPGNSASLVYWVQAIGGNTSSWVIGIVNFKDQTAGLDWYGSQNLAHIFAYGVKPKVPFPAPRVIGRAPHQELRVAGPWETPDDNQSYAVRQYSYVIAYSGDPPHYQVADDTRSLVGVEVSTSASKLGAKVEAVYPGTPAQGKLEAGDIIESVVGGPHPPDAKYLNGPQVIDQVALYYPAQHIVLRVKRGNMQLVVPITLGRWSPAVRSYVEVGKGIYVSM